MCWQLSKQNRHMMAQLNEIEADNVKFQIEYILGEIGNSLLAFVV